MYEKSSGSFPKDCEKQLIIPGIAMGLVAGILTIVLMVSFAALIFGGALQSHLNEGIGFLLFAAVVSGVWISLRSSFRCVVALPQDSATAIIAPIIAGMAAEMANAGSEADVFNTALVAMAFSTLLSGGFFLLIGTLKKAGIVRYIPYPVIGGFLAGTGWLLVSGGVQVMTGKGIGFHNFGFFVEANVMFLWIPGMIMGVTMYFITRWWNHFLLLPALILTGFVCFYAWLALSKVTLEEAKLAGALLGPFSDGESFRPTIIFALKDVEWAYVFSSSGTLFTVAIVTAVSLLLNANGLEILSKRDLDLNKELRVAGVANLLCGLGATGPAACHTLSISSLGIKANANTRLIGLTAAASCVGALFIGPSLLSYFPNFLLGGLLIFLGLSFLGEWIFESWKKLTKSEYAMVWAILIAMTWIGILEGVAIGLGIAVVVFVIDYSRINVIRGDFDGTTLQSNVERSSEANKLIELHGKEVMILQLQGYLFFGSSNNVLEKCRQRFEKQLTKFCMLDFKLVHKVDTSALYSLEKLHTDTSARDCHLCFVNPRKAVEILLKEKFDNELKNGEISIYSSLDYALEKAESSFIAETHSAFLPDWPEQIKPALADLPRKTFKKDDLLIVQGESHSTLLFIVSGQVTVRRYLPKGDFDRIKTVNAGAILGELGFFSKNPATAAVVARTDGELIYCQESDLENLKKAHPEFAQSLLEWIIEQLSFRTQRLIKTVEILKK